MFCYFRFISGTSVKILSETAEEIALKKETYTVVFNSNCSVEEVQEPTQVESIGS